MLQEAFETDDLPNRAEMRLRKTGRAIGYTLSRIHDDDGALVGATLFFKDLTRVEQIEERERLRDRLAALGEMAAAIAHEVKNPLASIEVMAGVLKRQLSEQPEALETLNDIIKEAKMANAIVVEVLEFVRPIQLQVERAALDEVLKDSITLAEGKMRRGAVSIRHAISRRTCRSCWPTRISCGSCSRTCSPTRSKRWAAKGHVEIRGTLLPGEEEPAGTAEPAAAAGRGRSPRQRAGHRAPTISSESSVRFSRPSRRAPASAWRSCARSSTRTTAASTRSRRPGAARPSG